MLNKIITLFLQSNSCFIVDNSDDVKQARLFLTVTTFIHDSKLSKRILSSVQWKITFSVRIAYLFSAVSSIRLSRNCKLAKIFLCLLGKIFCCWRVSMLTGQKAQHHPGPSSSGAAEVWPVVDWSNDAISVLCRLLRIIFVSRDINGKACLMINPINNPIVYYSRIVFSNRFIILISEN